MRVFSLLQNIAAHLLPGAQEVNLVPPDVFTFEVNSYAIDVLMFNSLTQSSGTAIETVEANAVIFLYLANASSIDDILTAIIQKLSYKALESLLSNYEEIVAVNVNKIITYGKNFVNKRAIAIHLNIITNI